MPFDARAFSRRSLLQLAASTGVASLLSAARSNAAEPDRTMRTVEAKDRKLLFILGAWGGASIIDSFMPVAEGEVGDFFASLVLNVFPDAQLVMASGTKFRVPKLLDDNGIFATPKFSIEQFATRHGKDLAVIAHEVSSVNHTVAQQRSLNGAGVNRGRTLMEAMALRYGGGMVLPNANMASDGFVRHGADNTVPPEARHELITTPLLFAAGTHGS